MNYSNRRIFDCSVRGFSFTNFVTILPSLGYIEQCLLYSDVLENCYGRRYANSGAKRSGQ